MTVRLSRALALSLLALVVSAGAVRAQFAPDPSAQPAQPAAPVDDGLNLRFANGIAAIAEGKIITVDDIRRRIQPLIPEIQRESRNEREFNAKLQGAQDEIIQEMIDNVLIVKEFYKDEKRRVPASFVDNQLSETIATQFDGDRSKYLAYLRSRGISQKEYRKEIEEEMVIGYMRQQQRKSASTVSPVKIETFYNENKDRFYQEDQVYLRIIQFKREATDTDETLRQKADNIITQLKAGTSFTDLARLYSQGPNRSKAGDMGWQRRQDLRKEFADPLFELKKGEYTQPLITPEGSFVLFAEDRKFAGVLPLDEVREQIERMLIQQSGRQTYERWLEKLRRNGYVKHF